jgi:hypothetical protein
VQVSKLEALPESSNDAVHIIFQDSDGRENGLRFNDLRLIQRYFKVELGILLHFRVKSGEEYVASLHHARGGKNGHEQLVEIRDRFIGAASRETLREFLSDSWRRRMSRDAYASREQHTMLIDNVQLVEPPEGNAPTFVWFDSIDEFYRLIPHSLYFSRASGCVLRGVFEDREAGVVVRRVSVGKNELPNQMIEGTPQIMDCVTSNANDLDGNLCGGIDIKGALRGLRIMLGSNCIWAGLKEGSGCGIEITDVLFGPIQLYLNYGDALIGGHEPQVYQNGNVAESRKCL